MVMMEHGWIGNFGARAGCISGLALALVLGGCGDDGNAATGATSSGTSSGTNSGTSSGTETTMTASSGSMSATEGTTTMASGVSASEGSSTTMVTATETATETMGTTATTAGMTGSGTDSDTSTGTDTDVCADADVTFEPQIPTVMLLIDQSGSMTAKFGGTTRWQAVYDALLNNKDGLVLELEDQVRFALGLYTSFNGNDGGECPVITEVSAGLGNYASIEAIYSASKPEDETPTGESILAVMDSLLNDPEKGDKVIVLATDGEPDTCAVPNPQTGQDVSVAAAVTAFDAGIKTFVISVGSQVSDKHLQDMANAGVGVQKGDPDAPFYKANNKDALVSAFQEIINGVRDCTLILDGQVQEGFEDQCIVNVNGDDVPYLDPDGWQLNEPSEIELVGKACQAIQQGEVSISIKCACGAIIPG